MTLTWHRLLQLMRARHWIVWGSTVLFAAAAMGLCLFVLPKRYTASADVLLDIREPDPVQGPMQTPALLSAGYVATQADIIVSDRVTRKVVRSLGLDSNPSAVQQWQSDGGAGTVEQYYMDALRRSLEVKPSRMSNVISVKFTSPSPTYAATVANAWAKAYIETNVELKADPARDFKVWFDARTSQAREQLEKAQSRLAQYQREHGIILATDEHMDVETARLSELSTQLALVQGQHAESESRRDQAKGQLGNSPDVLQNPLIQNLRADVARAEAKQEQLAKEMGRNHPSFLSSAAELGALKEKLDTEIHRVATSVGGTNSVNAQKEAQIRAALEAQKQRVLQLRAERDAAAVLRNDVESAKTVYDLVLQRLSATNLESQVQQTNVVLLSEALPPVKPSGPATVLYTILALLLGSLVGTTLTVLLEARRPRLRSIEDVSAVLQVAVLASLPHVRHTKAVPVQRPVAALPAPAA